MSAAEQLYGRSNSEMQAHVFKPDAPWIPDDERAVWEDVRRRVAAAGPTIGR